MTDHRDEGRLPTDQPTVKAADPTLSQQHVEAVHWSPH